MPGGSFATTGHTSGSSGGGPGAFSAAAAVSVCWLPKAIALSAVPKNVRRFMVAIPPSRREPRLAAARHLAPRLAQQALVRLCVLLGQDAEHSVLARGGDGRGGSA